MHHHAEVSAPVSAMTSGHVPAIRAELEQQRRFRTDQLAELDVDATAATAAADDPRRQVTSVLTAAAEAALAEIEAALHRLDDGSFGSCERCAEPIPLERLEVLPMSRLCTPCQLRLETSRGRGRRGSRPAVTRQVGGIR